MAISRQIGSKESTLIARDLSTMIVDEVLREISQALGSYEAISPEEMKELSKNRIKCARDLFEMGELDNHEATFLYTLFAGELVNAWIAQSVGKFSLSHGRQGRVRRLLMATG